MNSSSPEAAEDEFRFSKSILGNKRSPTTVRDAMAMKSKSKKGVPLSSSPTKEMESESMRKARGLQAQRVFNEALLNGATRARTLKVMFVGQGRAGKTSTLKALTGQPFRKDEKSTHGMIAGACEVSIDFLEQWNVVEKSEAECFRASFDHAVSTVVANKLKESESEPPDSIRKIAEQIASVDDDFAAPVSAMPVDLIRTMIDDIEVSCGR